MIDPLWAVARAFMHPSFVTFIGVSLAGVLTSVGPCVAPRYIAVAALAANEPRSTRVIGCFSGGLISTYVAIGWISGALGAVANASSAVNAAVAVSLAGGGLWTIVRPMPEHAHDTRTPRSLGAAFFLGAGSALVASPCCTPVIAAVVSYSAVAAQPAFGAALLFCFAIGHTAPIFLVGLLSAPARRVLSCLATAQAPVIAGGVLMLALGVLYGALV